MPIYFLTVQSSTFELLQMVDRLDQGEIYGDLPGSKGYRLLYKAITDALSEAHLNGELKVGSQGGTQCG